MRTLYTQERLLTTHSNEKQIMKEKIIDTIIFALVAATAGLILATMVAVCTIPSRLSKIEQAVTALNDSLSLWHYE